MADNIYVMTYEGDIVNMLALPADRQLHWKYIPADRTDR